MTDNDAGPTGFGTYRRPDLADTPRPTDSPTAPPGGLGAGWGRVPPASPAGVPAVPTESTATLSLVIALAGLFIAGLFVGPAAAIVGFQARKKIKQSRGQLKGTGLANAAIVIGIGTAVVYLVAILVLVASRPRADNLPPGFVRLEQIPMGPTTTEARPTTTTAPQFVLRSGWTWNEATDQSWRLAFPQAVAPTPTTPAPVPPGYTHVETISAPLSEIASYGHLTFVVIDMPDTTAKTCSEAADAIEATTGYTGFAGIVAPEETVNGREIYHSDLYRGPSKTSGAPPFDISYTCVGPRAYVIWLTQPRGDLLAKERLAKDIMRSLVMS